MVMEGRPDALRNRSRPGPRWLRVRANLTCLPFDVCGREGAVDQWESSGTSNNGARGGRRPLPGTGEDFSGYKKSHRTRWRNVGL